MVKTKRYNKWKTNGYRYTKKMIGGMTDEKFTDKLILAINEFNSSSKIFIKAQRKEKIRKLLSDFYTQITLDEHNGFKHKTDNLISSITYSSNSGKEELLDLNEKVELKIKSEKLAKEDLERTRLETERLERERLEIERLAKEEKQAKDKAKKRAKSEKLAEEKRAIEEAKQLEKAAKQLEKETVRLEKEAKQLETETARLEKSVEDDKMTASTKASAAASISSATSAFEMKKGIKKQKKALEKAQFAVEAASAAATVADEQRLVEEPEATKLEEKQIADTRKIISSTIDATLNVAYNPDRITKYENQDEIIAFWEKIMGRENLKWFMKYFRNTLYFMSTGEIPCNIQSNIASYHTSIPEYDHVLCASMYFISKLTELIHREYLIIFKGGKAVQLVCPEIYVSNDIDLMIIKNTSGSLEYSTETMAIEISKLYIWCLTYNISNKKHNISAIKIEQKEPIVKISLREPDKGFTPLIDISYKELSQEITAIYGRRFLQILNDGGTFGFFLSPNMNALIDERLYYLIKYFAGTYSVGDNLDYYVLKIDKSLKHLLRCISNGKNKSAETLHIYAQIPKLFSHIDPIVRDYSAHTDMAVLYAEIEAFDAKNVDIINEQLQPYIGGLIPSKQDEIKQKFRDLHKAKLRLKHTLEIGNPQLHSETTVKIMEFVNKL